MNKTLFSIAILLTLCPAASAFAAAPLMGNLSSFPIG